jgi:hypothetical protein
LTQTALKKTTWNTYSMSAYAYDVANDQRSAGGCHFQQVRKGPAGWQHRVRQSNGSFESFGPVTPISDAEGEAKFEQAKNY